MSADTQRIMATPQNQPLAEISDDDLRELLASDPYVKIRAPFVTVETQPERLPDEPDRCPVCGEPYERVRYDRDRDGGTHIAEYIHHLSGFGGDWCESESDWQAQELITVKYERAKRVSGGDGR